MRQLLISVQLLRLSDWPHADRRKMLHQLPYKQCLLLLFAIHLPGPHPWPLPRYLFSHSDRIFLWSTNGSDHRQSAGGYSFDLTWRSALPGVHASALGIFNFKTGPNSILSFRAELQNMTISGGTVLLEPEGTQAGIVFLAFSLIIVTQNTNYLELIVLGRTNLTSGSDPVLYANSSNGQWNDLNCGSIKRHVCKRIPEFQVSCSVLSTVN